MEIRKQLAELGQEAPPLSECPLELDDFPPIVHSSFDIFNQLPDEYIPRMDAAPFYSGKNLSVLPLLYDLFLITDNTDKLLVLEIINILDGIAKKELNRKK